LPRRVNLLCDRALYEGRLENANVISGEMLKRAARSLAGAQQVKVALATLETAEDAPADPAAAAMGPVAVPNPAVTSGGSADTAPAENPPLFMPVQEAKSPSEIPVTFGSDVGGSTPKRGRRLLFLGTAALVIALLGGGALGYFYAAGVLAADPGVPEAPARVDNNTPGPLLALPVPPEHEVIAALNVLAQTILVSGAGQFPDNRH
jgi:hypothetical protein